MPEQDLFESNSGLYEKAELNLRFSIFWKSCKIRETTQELIDSLEVWIDTVL